jgi:hypothetical protein
MDQTAADEMAAPNMEPHSSVKCEDITERARDSGTAASQCTHSLTTARCIEQHSEHLNAGKYNTD